MVFTKGLSDKMTMRKQERIESGTWSCLGAEHSLHRAEQMPTPWDGNMLGEFRQKQEKQSARRTDTSKEESSGKWGQERSMGSDWTLDFTVSVWEAIGELRAGTSQDQEVGGRQEFMKCFPATSLMPRFSSLIASFIVSFLTVFSQVFKDFFLP